MGRSELLLVLGALAILGRFSLTVNSTLLENGSRVLQGEFEMTAISAADALLEEAWDKAFDATAVLSIPTGVPEAFTDPGQLGPEGGVEPYPDYDDVDDFHNLTIADTAGNGMIYTLTATVGYVTGGASEGYSLTETTLKRMDVTVSSDYLNNDVTLSHIFSFVR